MKVSVGTSGVNLNDFIRCIPDYPKPGILFRDITPLLASPTAFRRAIDIMAEPFADERIDMVAAAEARGFIFAAPLAFRLEAGLIPIRKPGKLPCPTVSECYALEYGTDTLHVHRDDVPAGARVLVVDDLLATGGTIEACCKLIEKVGGVVAGCAFLIELAGLCGRARIDRYRVFSALRYEGA